MPSGSLLIATSLKMYFDHDRTLAWVSQLRDIASRSALVASRQVELAVFPSFPSLAAVKAAVSDTPVVLGAQNMAAYDSGPYTGEVSAATLAQVGCSYVEIGHIERRKLFGETITDIQQKVALATQYGLRPLLCVGEPEQVDPATAASSCIDFITAATADLPPQTSCCLTVAYEPVWAIGAAQPASTDHIRSVTLRLQRWLRDHPVLDQSRVIYGGSAGPGLISQLNGSVSGLFLGRFAHDPAAIGAILTEIEDMS